MGTIASVAEAGTRQKVQMHSRSSLSGKPLWGSNSAGSGQATGLQDGRRSACVESEAGGRVWRSCCLQCAFQSMCWVASYNCGCRCCRLTARSPSAGSSESNPTGIYSRCKVSHIRACHRFSIRLLHRPVSPSQVACLRWQASPAPPPRLA